MRNALTPALTMEELCDLATECEGDTAQTVSSLIGGVLARYGHLMDDAAHAALNAVRDYHVPNLADAVKDLEDLHGAD